MYTQHLYINPYVLSKEPGKAVISVNGLEEYLQEDFNITLAVGMLLVTELIMLEDVKAYETALDNYRYFKRLRLPQLTYQGPLADAFTVLQLDNIKIDAPGYKLNPDILLIESDYFKPKDLTDIVELKDCIQSLQWETRNKIATDINIQIDGISWPYKAEVGYDYSIPATLYIIPYKHDDEALTILKAEGEKIVTSFTWELRAETHTEEDFYTGEDIEVTKNVWVFTLYTPWLV